MTTTDATTDIDIDIDPRTEIDIGPETTRDDLTDDELAALRAYLRETADESAAVFEQAQADITTGTATDLLETWQTWLGFDATRTERVETE